MPIIGLQEERRKMLLCFCPDNGNDVGWYSADGACQGLSGNLPEIHSDEDNTAILNAMKEVLVNSLLTRFG
jgi:hypothetical protein